MGPRHVWASDVLDLDPDLEEAIDRATPAAGRLYVDPLLATGAAEVPPEDVDAFVRTSILPAHLARLPAERGELFAAAVVERVRLPLDYVRLNVSATRGRREAGPSTPP